MHGSEMKLPNIYCGCSRAIFYVLDVLLDACMIGGTETLLYLLYAGWLSKLLQLKQIWW